MKKPIQVFNFSIQNATDTSVDIHIDGSIVDASTQEVIKAWFGDTTSVSYKSFRNAINEVKVPTYNIFINSPGGHVGDALAMHDFMVQLQNDGKVVNTEGIGIVASSATLLLLAGKKPKMTANSWFMVHSVSGGIYGNVDEIEAYAKTTRKFNDLITNLYASKSGMRKEDVTKMMKTETWLTADEAKEKGFISEVSGAAPFSNAIDEDQWDYADRSILNKYNASVKQITQTQFDMNFFANLKKEIIAAIKGVKPGETFDPTAFINQMAEAIGKPFENLDATLTTEVGTAVNSAMTAALAPAVKTAVDAAVLPYENRIKTLETENGVLKTKNDELAQDIVNKIGGASGSGAQQQNQAKPIGSFSTAE